MRKPASLLLVAAILLILPNPGKAQQQFATILLKLEKNKWKPKRCYFSTVNRDSSCVYRFTTQERRASSVSGELKKYWVSRDSTKHNWTLELKNQLLCLTIQHEQKSTREYVYNQDSMTKSTDKRLYFAPAKNMENLDLKVIAP